MTPGWQVCCYAAALGAFLGAALAAWTKLWAWPVFIALGLALVTLVAVWNAAALN